ncbi:phenol hydroxylase subunit [Pseudomonas aeruginosa]|uniref:phenol hydroxylase subunit n=1 Tax=Pseudomonas aeruginosa TaxID=287 RepID=UPI000717944D|nr:phenol hydroxylase subunit [Pseudomonas aeruginosa]KRV32152.1 phenol hydroxylase [Pseudomonas aeruginosa]MCT5235652.1 phenol hydroxylase subunit [Pseudomonas aeruginosa]MCV6434579.1 phenol hydroxylase subunit [Pseudomonas aeruginosa]MCV6442192.1 phenol hydroxylase subunit [Pseudomonas aeruginosa]WGY40278.1 phenol hydroxylase subunit [Pseudomonas aeruginosa]
MNLPDESLDMQPADLDTRKRFVRVTGSRGSNFVEFDFAIGEPELFVEMILTHEAFDEFCRTNQVESMPALPEVNGEDDEAGQWDWRLADATQVRFKN